MKEFYVLGGFHRAIIKKSCLVYNFSYKRWRYKENMNIKRIRAACTVFEGKIVMSGGKYQSNMLKSVEASRGKYLNFKKSCLNN